MPDNPQAATGLSFALPDHRIIALTGRDAAAFAQAQFMNDVTLLAPGQWHWSGWLTPKGRVVALFAVLKFDEESLWLLVPDADPVTFAAALQRFVFRSKVSIATRDELKVEGAFHQPERARGNAFDQGPEGVTLDYSGDGQSRTLRIVPATTASHDAAAISRWAASDLDHGLPRLPAAQTDHWTPQQLSLERLSAFSVRKGCYPGQEIVARTHFLGKVKRGLTLVEGPVALDAGADLHAADAPLGHLVSSASANGRHLALAIVPLEHQSTQLSVGVDAVKEVPIRDGLAR